ncbi:MAG: hypothetical protein JNK00_13715 [Flavipsychrobacter sp.]|nr:hypothetical protein [Flavipsychrobacter sp.]
MKQLAIICTLIINTTCHAQDIIVKKNSETITSKVIEITQTDIKYKPYTDSLSPLRSVPKNDVLVVYYQNGTRETFSTAGIGTTTAVKERNPQEYRNGFLLGDIVMYKGKETGKYRKGRIEAFTVNGAIVNGEEYRMDEISKFFDQPKKQRKKQQ